MASYSRQGTQSAPGGERRVGATRRTMRENPLLISPELGKVRRASYALPEDQHTYGVKVVKNDGGAIGAIGHWDYGVPPARTQPRVRRDFIKLNRAAANAGMTNARELYQFSAIHEFPRIEKSARSARSTFPQPGTTFGKKTKPSTPLWNVMENKYQHEWIEKRYDPRESEGELPAIRPRYGDVYETHASLLRRHVETPQEQLPWRMERYRSLPGRVETFRSELAREHAMAAHSLDRVARTGTIGHGVYNTAKS